MENAAEALKIAFAVFVFALALTIAIVMLGQLNQVSQIILTRNDQTSYYQYNSYTNTNRIVGLETIIPTLYQYRKENYTVLFLKENGDPLPLYQSKRENWRTKQGSTITENIIAKYYGKKVNEGNISAAKSYWVCSFDIDEETLRNEPWLATQNDTKKNLDAFLSGGIFHYPDGTGTYNYNNKEGIKGMSRRFY